MYPNYLKFPAWLIVLWLISLQVLAPFAHAHLEAGGIDHASVMHLHISASSAPFAHDTNPALENPHGPHQIVSVAQGIPKKIEKSAGADVLPVMFMAVFVLLVTAFVGSRYFILPNFFHSIRHRSPQPQAPPCF